MNLPLIGVVSVTPVPAGAPGATLLAADNPDEMKPVVDLLTQTRKSLTLRSLFVTGFPYDPEFFAAGVALARQWSRQGLKVAVVDLDFRHPTVLRPKPSPNEGYVDALEYGCSFQRIGWELVNDALWLVGPGSHPPDEQRFAEHADWARVMRTFSARVDITLYLAPFLDRKGFTGSLSKRMDGVLLAASVRRSSRAALRDAFLELWGSDAPMIGCLGIETPHVLAPRGEVEFQPAAPWATESPAAMWAYPAPAAPASPPVERASGPGPEPAGETRATAGRRETERAPFTSAESATPASGSGPGERASQALVETLSDEVRRGQAPRGVKPRSRVPLLIAVALISLAAAGALFAYHAMRSESRRAAPPPETLPAGTEPVLPADLGTQGPGGVSGGRGARAENGSDAAGAQAPGNAGSTVAGGSNAGVPGLGKEPAPVTPQGTASNLEDLPYRVHVASFRDEKTVRGLVNRLRAKGLDAWYVKAPDQPDWYRVFVGHYASHQEAARKASWLLNHGWVDHAIAYPDTKR